MAKTARQFVFEGMELLPTALVPFVEKKTFFPHLLDIGKLKLNLVIEVLTLKTVQLTGINNHYFK